MSVVELYYLDNPGSGNTTSSPVLAFKSERPGGTILRNYDTDRDDDWGLVIEKGDELGDVDDPDKAQRWAASALGTTLDGPIKLRLHAAPKDLDWDDYGEIVVAVQRCSSDLSVCDTLTSASRGFYEPEVLWFARLDVELPAVNATFTAAKPLLVLSVVVGENSENDVWLAYDTATYAASMEIMGY